MFKHFFWISGRSSRVEFMFWGLICQLVTCAYLVLQLSMPLVSSPADYSSDVIVRMLFSLLMMPVSLVCSWIYLTLAVRRLHDLNLSGWWMLTLIIFSMIAGIASLFMPSWFIYVPQIIGLGVLIYLTFTPGKPATNKYGEVPTRTYAPAFLSNQAGFYTVATIVVISLVSFYAFYARASQQRLEQVKQFQQQYLEQMMQQMPQQPNNH